MSLCDIFKSLWYYWARYTSLESAGFWLAGELPSFHRAIHQERLASRSVEPTGYLTVLAYSLEGYSISGAKLAYVLTNGSGERFSGRFEEIAAGEYRVSAPRGLASTQTQRVYLNKEPNETAPLQEKVF
jgi:hypothetical protein